MHIQRFAAIIILLVSHPIYSQTTQPWNPALSPGGANSMLFRFTKQVWLNPTIILTKQRFEEETHAKLLILPRFNDKDTSAKRIEKAFDAVLSFLVYKENTEGSIKFYFDPKNKIKPFSFGTSEELWCKFSLLQKDTVEQLLNAPLANSSNLDNFSTLPFDSIISQTSKYCKRILLSKPGPCGADPENDFTLSKLNCVPARLSFERVEQSTLSTNGGVDEQKYPSLASYYNSVTDLSDKSNYPIAWKAVAAGKNDVIRIKITKKEKNFNYSKLVFKNSSGTETYNTGFDKTDSTIITLSILGKPSGSMLEVVANYTNKTGQSYVIGAFNIFFYEPKQLTLKVWDVGGAEINTKKIEEELNKIYNNVFISWKVEQVCGNIQLSGSIKKNIHVEKSGLLSNYMDDMKPVINYLKDNCTAYDSKAEDTYYLILGCKNDGGLGGYMPRARNIGFVFNTDAHTMAHELGHGAFNLKHIFTADELGEGYRHQTDNLMDYAEEGTSKPQNSLYKHQWDLIYNPDFVGWFEGDDKEGSIVAGPVVDSLKLYNGSTEIHTSSYQLISAVPEMPDIRIKPSKKDYTGTEEIEIRVKIIDQRTNASNVRVRNDSTFYPSDAWKKVKINTEWDVDFGTEMRGGKAIVYYKSGGVTKSIEFYIRGTNPTEEQVRSYFTAQNYTEWYLIKILRHESGSVLGQPMRQFRQGTNYNTTWSWSSPGCPTLGAPRGFGLMQLDNFGPGVYPTANQVWNWKANVDRGVQFVRNEKKNWATNRMGRYRRVEGPIYSWNEDHPDDEVNDSIFIESGEGAGTKVLTIQEGSTTINETFAISPVGTQKSIIDAITLRAYNGGAYCSLFVPSGISGQKPYWIVNRVNSQSPPFNYVSRICETNP